VTADGAGHLLSLICELCSGQIRSVRTPPYPPEHMFLTTTHRLHSWLQAVDRAVDDMLAWEEPEPARDDLTLSELVPAPVGTDERAEPEPAGKFSAVGAGERHRHPHRRAIVRRPRLRREGALGPTAMPCISPLPAAQACLAPPSAPPACPHASPRTRD
jgi:hypothetical protein